MNLDKLMVSEIAWQWRKSFGGSWTWTVFLISALKEGLFCMANASWCLDREICQVIFILRKKNIQKPKPDKSSGMTQVLLYLLLAMKSELTAGSSGSASALMIS